MDVNLLNQQLVNLVTSMFQEGFLDEQFTQLQMLQDARNPGFVADVISLFSEDSERLLAELTKTLEQDPADFKKIVTYVHQFKGSSSSIGAYRVKVACMDFHAFCEKRNREGCLLVLQQLKQEFYLVKTKLDVMLQMEQKLLAAGGVIPIEFGFSNPHPHDLKDLHLHKDFTSKHAILSVEITIVKSCHKIPTSTSWASYGQSAEGSTLVPTTTHVAKG